MKFMGQRVILTGASRGIGAATARAFAAQGAQLVLLARDQVALEALACELPQAQALVCDLTRPEEVSACMSKAVTLLGGVDILINNAGTLGPLGPLHEAEPQAWLDTQMVNFGAVFQAVHTLLPQFLAQGHGTVITVSSGAAHRPVEGWSAYCASKAAAFMLTQSLHHDYAAQGLRALSLSPGTVATQMQREIKASGISPVAKLDWETHFPANWAAKAILWMSESGGDAPCGVEISLRDPVVQQRLGVV